MLTIQELIDLAMPWPTAMSDAMIVACIQRHYLTGEPLVVPRRPMRGLGGGQRPGPLELTHAEWRRYVEKNGDTRLNHC